MNKNIRILSPEKTLEDAFQELRKTFYGIVVIVDENRKFLGILTDGDFRKAFLARSNLKKPCGNFMNRSPKTIPTDMPDDEVRATFFASPLSNIHHLPVLDKQGTLVKIASLSDYKKQSELPVRAVIMAGGFGTRLGELTKSTPKPMLDVGGKPLLERIIDNLKLHGIRDIILSTHYMPEIITDYFGNGDRFGVKINYVHEDRPLGTAGALTMLDNLDRPLLVMNGDILTNLNFQSFYEYHLTKGADLTVATRYFDFEVPYGVLEVDDNGALESLQEKPLKSFQINAGIYCMNPSVLKKYKPERKLLMTELIEDAKTAGKDIYSFVMHEHWLDIGQPSDYAKAKKYIEQEKKKAAITQ